MLKPTLATQVLFGRTQKAIWLCVFFVLLLLSNTFIEKPAPVEAATSNTMNFQARLLTSSGSVVPDGYYNAEFKLYNVASGGSALWTETYYDSNGVTAGNDNRVRVVNGYLTVNLNALNNNWGGVSDWSEEMWLTMNIGGTGHVSNPSWDGEMSPRLKLTAVPYAFEAANADKLGGVDADQYAQLGANQTFTGVNSFNSNSTTGFQIQNAGGTSNLLVADTANSKIGIGAAPGGGGATLQVTGDISSTGYINAPGFVGQTLRYNQNSAAAGGAITTLACNSGALDPYDVVSLVNSNSCGKVVEASTLEADTKVIGVNGGSTVVSGTTQIEFTIEGHTLVNATGSVNIGDQLVTSTTPGHVKADNRATKGILGLATSSQVSGTGTVGVYVRTYSGQDNPVFRNNTNASAAFQIQNASGASLFNIDTTGGTAINIGTLGAFTDDFETGDMFNWTTTTNINASTDKSFSGTYSAKSDSVSSSSYAEKTISATSSLSLSARVNFANNNSTALDFLLVGNGTQLYTVFRGDDDILCLYNGYVASAYCGTYYGDDTWYDIDFRITKGNPGKMQLYVDGVLVIDQNVNVGTTDFNRIVAGNPLGARTGTIYIDDINLQTAANAATSLNLYGGLNSYASSTFNGQVTVKNNMTAGFVIQNSGGTNNLFIADTVNNKVGIGANPNANGAALQVVGGLQLLDTSTPSWSSDLAGSIMYDSTAGKFYVYDETAKKELCNKVDASCGGNASTLQDAYEATVMEPEITVNSTRGGLTVRDNITPIGGNLLEIQSNDGSVNYLSVAATGTKIQAGSAGVKLQDLGGNTMFHADTNNAVIEVAGDIYSAGLKWTSPSTSIPSNLWSGIAYGNGLYVAVSTNGTNRVMTSPDGINWTARTSAAANSWGAVTYGNGLFVAVASSGTGNRVMTSPDGINWTSRASAADNGWRSITYGNGLFVAVAPNGTGQVMTSPDGINWTQRSESHTGQWFGVTYGNGMFVAVAWYSAGNRIMTSPDGITWTSQAHSVSNAFASVAYANGLFVAVGGPGGGGPGVVMTSPDGTTWTTRSASEENYWNSITYGNGLFVAVSTNGTNRVMTSPDGITWTARKHTTATSWGAVTFGNGMFVSVAQTGGVGRIMLSGKPNAIITSTNNIYQGGMKVYGDSVFNSGANSTTAFQIQNAAGGNLFNVDTTNNVITLNGSSNGALRGWTTSANPLSGAPTSSARQEGGVTVSANGYIYMIGGTHNTDAQARQTVMYAKLNSDGSNGAWTTSATNIPAVRVGLSAAYASNGYIYAVGGRDTTGTAQTSIYYGKVGSDGNIASWTTTTLPQLRHGHRVIATNGYLYVLGGENGVVGYRETVFIAKINADGSLGNWRCQSASPGSYCGGVTNNNSYGLPSGNTGMAVFAANGYLYSFGGYAGGTTTNVQYAKINADGSTGAWTDQSSNKLPGARGGATAGYLNGYAYVIGGWTGSAVSTSVYYAPLNADGSTGAWTTEATNTLPVARNGHGGATYNGRIYSVGGYDGSSASTAVYYTSGARTQIAGGLDLLSLNGQSGGELTAGNTNIVGNLDVRGSTTFNQGVAINEGLTVGGDALFRGASNSTTAFQVQNSTGSTLLNVDTTTSLTTVNGSALIQSTTNNANTLQVVNASGAQLFNVDTTNSNIIANGSFEGTSGTTGWAKYNGAETAFTTTSAAAYTGTQSLLVTNNNSSDRGVKYNLTTTTLSSNSTYSFTFSAKVRAGDTAINNNLFAGRADNGSSDVGCSTASAVMLTDEWTTFTCQFTTGTTSGTPYVFIKQTDSVARTIYIDGVQLIRESILANSSMEDALGASNWQAKGSPSNHLLSTDTYYDGVNSLRVQTNGTANQGTRQSKTLVTNTTYTLSFYAVTGSGGWGTLSAGYSSDGSTDNTACLTNQTLDYYAGWTNFTCSFTTPGSTSGTPYVYIKNSGATNNIMYLDAIRLTQGASMPQVGGYREGTIALNGVISSPAVFQNQTNSNTAFRIQNASGANIITADTVNNRVLMGAATAATWGSAELVVKVAEVQSGLRVGDATNGFSFNDAVSGKLRLSGTARNTKKVVMTPEYAGAVLDGIGTGTMTAGYDGTQRTNYYKWTTSQVTSQTYDVVITTAVPSDWSAWSASNAISVSGWSSNLTNSTGALTVISSNGTTDVNAASITPGSTSTWTTTNANLTSSSIYTADGTMVIRLRVTANNSSSFQLGNVTLTYLSQF